MRPALQVAGLEVRDQRREPRRPASGAAKVRTTGPHAMEIEGRLIDISPSGFRLAHESRLLEAGAMVEFTHGEASGTARVVWNRIAGDVIETGFFVVARS